MTEDAEVKRRSTNIGCISVNCECKRGPKLPFISIQDYLLTTRSDPNVELMDTKANRYNKYYKWKRLRFFCKINLIFNPLGCRSLETPAPNTAPRLLSNDPKGKGSKN